MFRQRITRLWNDMQPWIIRIKKVLINRSGEGTIEGVIEVFSIFSRVLVNGKTYLVERHFNGERDSQQAVFSVVENEAKREKTVSKSA